MTSDRIPAEAFPPARGARLLWTAVPEGVRRALEDIVGARIVAAIDQLGGFSPGMAARTQLSDGRRVFIKAISTTPNPESPELHRREAVIAARLPAAAPVPRFLGSFDDGEWVALVFEDIEGEQPELPWRSNELERVLDALSDLSASLTPSPVEAEAISEDSRPFIAWRQLTTKPDIEIDPWARDNLARLAELESEWMGAARGETLLHADLRADNILLGQNRVVFIDWPHACIGAAWVDLAFFLPSVAMQGGPEPWTVFDSHRWGPGPRRRTWTAWSPRLRGTSCGKGCDPRHQAFPPCQRSHVPMQWQRWRGCDIASILPALSVQSPTRFRLGGDPGFRERAAAGTQSSRWFVEVASSRATRRLRGARRGDLAPRIRLRARSRPYSLWI